MAPKIVCVVGPTACGKTTLGVQLAKQFNGEVVSADSMQIYMGMTIGTAAPTEAEMDGVHGDCQAKHLVYLTSGGDFEHEDSIGVLHWRQLCGLFGIDRFEYVFAGGLDIDPALTAEQLEGACALARRLAESI